MERDDCMLCQKCQSKPANFFYKESVNGIETKYALCSDCAQKMQANGELGFLNNTGSLLNFSFFDSDLEMPNPATLFGTLFGYPGGKTRGLAGAPQGQKRCGLCGSSYSDIMKTGKLGCPRCYDNFAEELGPTLRTIHGNVRHIGRAPKRFRQKNDRQLRIEKLKEELARAIQAEAYEQAAKLRDQIRGLENQ